MEKKKVSLNNYNQSIPNVILDNNETTTVAFETGNVFSNYFAKLVIYIYIYINYNYEKMNDIIGSIYEHPNSNIK